MRIHLPEWSLHSTARSHRRRLIAALGKGRIGRIAFGDPRESRQRSHPGTVFRRKNNRSH